MVSSGTVSADFLPQFVTFMLVLIGSLTVHEWGHAASAYWLGDDTAARMGRLTLNPLPHIDPIGTLLLPAMMIIMPGLPLFGWAKPVPVNSARFTRKVTLRGGEALTGVAGPLMNVILAILAATAFGLIGALKPEWLVDINDTYRDPTPLYHLLRVAISLNVALAFFNMIPVPPLDGGWVLQWVIPPRFDWVVQWLAQHGMIVLMASLFGPGYLTFLAPPVLVQFASPSTVVRILAAGVLSAVSVYAFAQIKTAVKAGKRGSVVGLEKTVEWTLPLAVGMSVTQVSLWMIGIGNGAMQGLSEGIMMVLSSAA